MLPCFTVSIRSISISFQCSFVFFVVVCFISSVKYVTAFVVIANLITWILDFVTLRKEEGEYDIDINYSDYRQTINIIAAYYITDEKYICEMNACYYVSFGLITNINTHTLSFQHTPHAYTAAKCFV